MIRLLLTSAVLAVALSSAAGTIEYNYLHTYDTGIRLANGRWRIGAEVRMTYRNFLGDIAEGDWEASLWINNIHNGSLLAGSGTQRFTGRVWTQRIEANANFGTCYQGKAYAAAGGDTKQVGGNHVCTDFRPPSDPPPCDEDCQSPIVMSFGGGYDLTSAADGVRFDIDADGTKERIAWTRQGTNVAFLAVDRDGNGVIDSGAELFGDSTRLRNGTFAVNGFEALADLDSNGDGRIDANDPAWQHLLLWFDTNHDGDSAAAELTRLPATRVRAISTEYQPSRRIDAFGNEFRYKGEFMLDERWRKCFDVFLVAVD